MSHFEYEPTKTAEWRKLVIQAEEKSDFKLTEALENYVVITLDAYTTQVNIASSIIAIDFLENIHVHSLKNMHALRAVGDQCLLLSGLFPERAKRKRVSSDYFQHLGMNAYYVLSYTNLSKQLNHALFYQLFENFAELIDVLKWMRK